MERKIIQEAVTFDDVLLIPDYSEVTPDTADLPTRPTRHIRLHAPLVPAPMHTVTAPPLPPECAAAAPPPPRDMTPHPSRSTLA